jgi:YD repeat-containing protein
MKSIKYLLILLLITNEMCFSQTNTDLPTIIPSSPEAHGMGKYGDIPISTYTGTPDISIPIHTIKIGKLSLPITLSYHATGIEVSQESSWVGLGWNLIAGGNISYIPVGADDRLVSQPLTYDLKFILDYVSNGRRGWNTPLFKQEDWYVNWDCPPATNDTSIKCVNKDYIFTSILNGAGEPDVYSANFLNYSFKFIRNPLDNKFLFLGQKNKCKIEGTGGTNGFVITGEDGTMYHFKSYESRSTSILSWFLTKIISPTGDEITLKYKKAWVSLIPPLSESLSIGEHQPKTTNRNISSDLDVSSNLCYLDTIETRNERVIFESDNRVDISGGVRLTRIIIKDKLTNSEKITYRFCNNNYFTGNSTGADYLTDDPFYASIANNFSSDNKSKRLKLDSLVQCNNSVKNDTYAFTYNDSVPLPYKTSFAMDYWGNYNGQENGHGLYTNSKHTIIPNIFALILDNSNWNNIPTDFYKFDGAIRGASKAHITAGMLTSIQYPTKGKTVFEFEPNDFYNHKYISSEDEVKHFTLNTVQAAAVMGFPSSPQYNIAESTFTLEQETLVSFYGYINLYDAYMNLEAVNVPSGFSTINYKYDSQTPSNGHKVEWNEDIWLHPGTYKLKCYMPFTSEVIYSPVVYGTLSYKKYDLEVISNQASVGGGVRIKKVTNYDENNTIVSTKRYNYTNQEGNTSGKLLIPMRNLKYKQIKIGYSSGITLSSPTYTLYGSSYISLSGLPCGNNVGYDRVEVESYSRSGNNGKEISYFSNSEASLFYDKIPYYYGQIVNGNLLAKIIVNNIGDTVLVEKNNYNLLSGTNTSEFVNVLIEDLYSGPTNICDQSGNPLMYIGRYNIYTYPTENYFVALTKNETTHYFSNGKLKEDAEYFYNPDNFCIKSIKNSTSNGLKYTNMKYPCDFPDNPILRSMGEQNQINTLVEKCDSINADNKLKISTEFNLWHNSFYAPERISSKKDNNSSETRIHYYDYDDKGNVCDVSKENDLRNSYIWDYNQAFPVVKIVGKAYADIPESIKTAITGKAFSGSTNYEAIKADRKYIYDQLGSILSDRTCMVTYYTYAPLIGLTSQTDPNGVTTYYEYDDFGRLKCIKDNDGNILKTYDYNYKR